MKEKGPRMKECGCPHDVRTLSWSLFKQMVNRERKCGQMSQAVLLTETSSARARKKAQKGCRDVGGAETEAPTTWNEVLADDFTAALGEEAV